MKKFTGARTEQHTNTQNRVNKQSIFIVRKNQKSKHTHTDRSE